MLNSVTKVMKHCTKKEKWKTEILFHFFVVRNVMQWVNQQQCECSSCVGIWQQREIFMKHGELVLTHTHTHTHTSYHLCFTVTFLLVCIVNVRFFTDLTTWANCYSTIHICKILQPYRFHTYYMLYLPTSKMQPWCYLKVDGFGGIRRIQ